MDIELSEMPSTEIKYFVGSISFGTTDQGLRDYFAQYGHVTSSSVIEDKMTGNSKGFGFVTMRNPISNLSQVNNSELDGRTIFVDEARPSEAREGGARPSGFNRDITVGLDKRYTRFIRDDYSQELKDVVEKKLKLV